MAHRPQGAPVLAELASKVTESQTLTMTLGERGTASSDSWVSGTQPQWDGHGLRNLCRKATPSASLTEVPIWRVRCRARVGVRCGVLCLCWRGCRPQG